MELAQACIRSLAARYPNDKSGSRPGPANMTDDVYESACVKFAAQYVSHPDRNLGPLDYISMSKCYEYQSCECAEWVGSEAHTQIQWIIGEALRLIPGYNDAIRDYEGPQLVAA